MNKIPESSRKYLPLFRRLLKEALLMLWIQTLVLSPTFIGATPENEQIPIKVQKGFSLNQAELIRTSQISYRAVGGFSGVKSYSVLISCVEGRISTLTSIHDPRLQIHSPVLRKKGTLDLATYLSLWNALARQNVLNVNDAPQPGYEILDEFTVHFEATIGSKENQFQADGVTRPEASRYYAIKSLMDKAVNMASLWNTHQEIALK